MKNNYTRLSVEIKEANSEDKNSVENLFQFYLHDLSEYTDNLNIAKNGNFDTSDVELFFTKDNLLPLKIVLEDEIIGFIFLIKGKTVNYVINDMFILRKFRNRGLGKIVVKKVFTQYKGTYAVMQLINNKSAVTFWHSLYNDIQLEYEESQMVSSGETCLLQKFTV
ncbi:GNAT family N-acetyltransferase [Virgibacillus pantothenticus]|uniref:GNAT family N-acetyltransferase n=1 Tax=Virgibacillus pantothenticus TaxID=1473 RepID=UPI001C218532|nr:GNAT family N-acetyltransferase [Virgibacillus pantothenticus]MBU8567943.1 GNAT family N-acetyltransferase [Virgibacillus pantothenticus]MBU8601800.1 GNAT family N-acetyltransferase [Virgibacillus pantothenticus]MBU8635954.1 GNAT family N-acetyltransferase [Virgibacillus pantothenticus]MBU8643638.1 GNAT family N-acetyltransferase [Virgibacillus pantothenticus]MBU8647778.1 GNAT family N-acetyltransferase [Virgibacillus pantothenticus]